MVNSLTLACNLVYLSLLSFNSASSFFTAAELAAVDAPVAAVPALASPGLVEPAPARAEILPAVPGALTPVRGVLLATRPAIPEVTFEDIADSCPRNLLFVLGVAAPVLGAAVAGVLDAGFVK